MSRVVSTLLMTLPDRGDGWVGSWSPGIGDPTVVGWVTVVAYFVTCWLCFRVAGRYRVLGDGPDARARATAALVATLALSVVGNKQRTSAIPLRERVRALWFGIAVVLLLLGINKQLDLQTALTEWGRMVATSEGWYDVRRPVQVAFIAAIVALGFVALRAVTRLARGDKGLRPVIGGVIFLACFVVIRASSFHHVDKLLGADFAQIRLNWIIELGGIAFIAAGAYRQERATAPRKKPQKT